MPAGTDGDDHEKSLTAREELLGSRYDIDHAGYDRILHAGHDRKCRRSMASDRMYDDVKYHIRGDGDEV